MAVKPSRREAQLIAELSAWSKKISSPLRQDQQQLEVAGRRMLRIREEVAKIRLAQGRPHFDGEAIEFGR